MHPIVDLIKTFCDIYANFKNRMGNSSLACQVKTGVRQGCVMSAFALKHRYRLSDAPSNRRQKEGIYLCDGPSSQHWKTLILLMIWLWSHTLTTTCKKKYHVSATLHSKRKSEVMALNISDPLPIRVNGEALPTTDEFTYLGSTVRHDGGAHSDIKNRMNKARNAFRILNNIIWSQQYRTTQDKTQVTSELRSIHPAECWRMTASDISQLSVFHTRNL